ncbi:hypothetical protein MKX03_008535 [Papaver bracteatum]|nr:hypothetical protein MKX03_008535 [Papaver bracteatum]
MSKEIQQTHLKPEIEKDKVLGFIPSQHSVHQIRVVSELIKKKEMVASNDESSSVLMVEMNNKEDIQEPISPLRNVVKKNQEPVGKGRTELDDSFIQEKISSKESAKEEKDVITGDQHLILVVETTQDDFTKSNSISSSQEMISDVINWGKWGEPSSLCGSSNNGMSSGIWSDNIRQQVEKCSRRKFTETNLKNDVLSVFVEAINVFCHKKSDGNKG